MYLEYKSYGSQAGIVDRDNVFIDGDGLAC